MKREDAIEFGKMWLELQEDCKDSNTYEFFEIAIEALQQKPTHTSSEEIINIIHKQGVENVIFELLTQWMIEDRYEKMKKLGESKATIRAIHKIATQNKNVEQAIDGIISLSESEIENGNKD